MKTNKTVWIKSNEQDMEKEVLFITKNEEFRIIRTTDNDYDLEDACKVMFSAKDRKDISEHKLKKQEQEFRQNFHNYGAVTITLEKRDLDFDDRYYTVESCGGFVGWENFGNNHYFIKELKLTANKIVQATINNEKVQKKLDDDKNFINNELSKFRAKCEKKGIDANYTTHLAFIMFGKIAFKHSPNDFYSYINEIVSAKVA